jgi:hypothetical protein
VAALIVLLGALGAAIGFLPGRWRAPAVAIGVLLLLAAAQLSFDAGWVVPVIAPVGVFVVAALASFLVRWAGRRARRRPSPQARSMGSG